MSFSIPLLLLQLLPPSLLLFLFPLLFPVRGALHFLWHFVLFRDVISVFFFLYFGAAFCPVWLVKICAGRRSDSLHES